MSTHEHDDDDRKRAFDRRAWLRLLAFIWPFRAAAAWLGAAGVTAALVETVIPYLTGRLLDAAIAGAPLQDMTPLGAVYLVSVLALVAAIWVLIVFAGKLATGVAHDLRKQCFRRLQELPFSFYDTRPIGWLIARMTSDVGKVSNLLPWLLVDLAWGSSVLAAVTTLMFILDADLAWVVLTVAPPMVAISVLFQRWLLDSSRAVRRTNARMTASFTEGIAGVRTTRALSREAGNLAEFTGETQAMFGYAMRHALQSAAYLPLIVSLSSVAVGVALWQGGVKLESGLTIGRLVTFMQYAALFAYPVQELARRFTDLQATQAAVERVFGLLDTVPEIQDRSGVRERMATYADERPDGIAEDGYSEKFETLRFEDVEFGYGDGVAVLHGIEFEARAGQTVALVGPTGGGKTTLISLLARFYEPRRGAITLDGIDTRDRSLHWLQSNLGVVLQNPHLFSGTVAQNIRYGRLEATDEDVRAAAHTVHAHAFIEGLADGYLTEVGEGGSRLSTGQRQLICLARAVLADPQIFILDEATSSIDTETEAAVQAGIEAALRGRLAFVIAHRLSTIVRADLILVIDGGRIVERGTHAELLARGGHYARLHREHGVDALTHPTTAREE